MVINHLYPTLEYPCLVQINYLDGDIGFYICKNFEDVNSPGLNYQISIVALFKCKLKIK